MHLGDGRCMPRKYPCHTPAYTHSKRPAPPGRRLMGKVRILTMKRTFRRRGAVLAAALFQLAAFALMCAVDAA